MSTEAGQQIPGRRALMPGWMKSHMDRLNTVANLDDLCSSPPETESGFLRDMPLSRLTSAHPSQAPSGPSTVRVSGVSKCELPRLASEDALRHQVLNHHGPSLQNLGRGSGSGSESAHTTPSVTPQGSPSLVRRVVEADLTAVGVPMVDGSRLKSKPKKKPPTRFAVTKFDLNAVSPTSW
uniref:Uncharacterized protein n=1 Tax=Amblyomma variegatum TaxID=34610 RepID=F0JA79_AMBVA|nr:TPA_inf: hypothetical protein 76 [Amblyomma variegatum]